jgi:hypothetical protein
MHLKILIACEYSGVVRDAFRKLGHDAWSCDIIPTESDPKYHYQCDVLEVIQEGWDMMIAHPPCTYLSNAGAKHLYPKGKLNLTRYEKGIAAREFFLNLYRSDISKIAIENPVPNKIFMLPNYHQVIQPYEYGEPYKKRTCLWLKGLPPLKPTKILHVAESTRVAGNWFNKGGNDRQKNRAKTFQGIADAMAEQWTNIEIEQLRMILG